MKLARRQTPYYLTDDLTPEPYIPLTVTSQYKAPKTNIDPDSSKSWISRVMPVLKAHKGMFLSALILSFVSLAAQAQVPAIIKLTISNAIQSHQHSIGYYSKFLVIIIVIREFSLFISRRNLLKTAYAIEFDLRNLIYGHLTEMQASFYDTVQSGQLISRANSDITALQRYLVFGPNIMVQCCVVFLAFAEMIAINWELALITMATMPATYFLGLEMRKRIWPISWVIQARLADVAEHVSENVNGVRVVKSFAQEQQELSKLETAADRLMWSYTKDADVRGTWAPTIENLPRLGLGLILLFGGLLAVHNPKLLGTIVAFNIYLLMFQPPFRQLGMVIMLGQRAKTSANRIYEILDQEPTIVDREGAIDLDHCNGRVDFDNVTFAYGGDGPVLRNFELHMAPGETLVLVGRTGSGKTTVGRLMDRFYDVNEGAVRIDGVDVRDLTLRSLRNKVGVVLDEPFLFSDTVRANIAYGRPDATLEEVIVAAKAASADGFINRLEHGYDEVIGERGYTLSGGQRQRIAIARTLLMNPPVLILDDATSAIDVQVEQRIHGELRKLLANRTTLVIAHRLSTISLADRVALIDDGQIVAIGTHTELLESEPRYSEVLAQVQALEEATDVLRENEQGEV